MRMSVLGCPVDVLTMDEAIAIAHSAMRERRSCVQVSLNVAKLVSARTDRELAADIANADMIGVDGMGIALAARLTGLGKAPRIAGIDLFDELMSLCAREGFRPYLLGAREDVLQEAIARLKSRHPGLQFAGEHHGYFDGRDAEVVGRIRAAQPDCLFLAMPSPRKERFMARWRAELETPFTMGIGGSLDVMAGKVRRAPVLVQKLGCEWLYRLVQEPRRMWRRYLSTNLAFAWLLAVAIARRARGGAPASPSIRTN